MEALAVIWSPVSALARVAEERRVLLGFSVTALYAALSLISASLMVFGGLTQAQFETGGAESPPGFEDFLEDFLVFFEIYSLVLAVVSPFIWWLLVSGLMYLVTRFFGGTGPFSGMLAVVGVAQAPFVINAIIGLPIAALQIALLPEGPTPGDPETVNPAATAVGWLGFLLGLAFLIWHAVLVVIGAAFARRVGYGESAGSCAISCAGCVGLILIVAVVFVVLIFVLAGAAGPSGPS